MVSLHPLVRDIHQKLAQMARVSAKVNFCWVTGYLRMANKKWADLVAWAAPGQAPTDPVVALHYADHVAEFRSVVKTV